MSKKPLILGIETSCDETAASIITENELGNPIILSNIVSSQVEVHKKFGGVVPELAARSHIEKIDLIVQKAIYESGKKIEEIDAVASTAGPGLVVCLSVGLSFGKALAASINKPFIAVNHLEGHALSPKLNSKLNYPYLFLLISGGHSQFLNVQGLGKYKRLGTTIEDALGEAFDKTAKLLGIEFPGGPMIEILAKKDGRYWLGKDINQNMRRLNQLNLGIIGLGRIGGSIARKFLPFSRNIGFYDPYIPNGYEKVYGINRYKNLSELLKTSDIVSINTPLNEETKGMVNADFLNMMKKGSYLINLSRGPIIQDKELILKNLLSNNLEGYGTDVWTNEPPLENDEFYKYLRRGSNELNGRVIINPHTAYYSAEAIYECRSKACSTCLDIIYDRTINTRVI